MMNNEDETMDHKKSVLMDLLSKMKELQAIIGLHGNKDESEHPDMSVEMHEAHAEPLSHDDAEKLEEATHTDLDQDNEEGESPEHKAMVLGSDKSNEDESNEDESNEDESNEDHMPEEQEAPMHPGLAALLAEHMKRK